MGTTRALVPALGALALILWGTGCVKARAPTLASVLAENTEARGGAEALEAVETLQLELQITEPTFEVSGVYRATRAGWMRVDIFAGDKRVFTEALGPEGAWAMGSDGEVTEVSREGRAALLRGLHGNLYGLHEYAELGIGLELQGMHEEGELRLWKLKKTSPGGFTSWIFIDAESGLLVREVETSALHPDVDPTEVSQQTTLSEHRKVNEVVFSHRSEKIQLPDGPFMQRVVVTSRQVNPPLDEALFRRP